MCLSGQTLSENTEFTSYSRHIRVEKTLFLIQTWKENTIGYTRVPSGLTEGPDHRPLTQPLPSPPPRHLCHPSATETQLPIQLAPPKHDLTPLTQEMTPRTFKGTNISLKSGNYQIRQTFMIRSQNKSLKLGMMNREV